MYKKLIKFGRVVIEFRQTDEQRDILITILDSTWLVTLLRLATARTAQCRYQWTARTRKIGLNFPELFHTFQFTFTFDINQLLG